MTSSYLSIIIVLLIVAALGLNAQISIGQSSFCSQVDFTTSGLVAQILEEVNGTVSFPPSSIHIFGNGTSPINKDPISPLVITNNKAQCSLQWQDIRDVFSSAVYANKENATIGFSGTITTSTCSLQIGYMGINGMSQSSVNGNLYLCSISGNQSPDKRGLLASKSFTIVHYSHGNSNATSKEVFRARNEKAIASITSAAMYTAAVEVVDKRATNNICSSPDAQGQRQCYCYIPNGGAATFVRLVCSYRSNHVLNENNRIAAINYVNAQYKAGNSTYTTLGSYVSTRSIYASANPSSNDGLFSTLFLGSNFNYKPPTVSESNCCNAIMNRYCAPNPSGQTSWFNECSPQSPTSQWNYIMGPQYI